MKKRILPFLLIGCFSIVSMNTIAAETDISDMSLEELRTAYLELQESYHELETKYNALLPNGNADVALSDEDFGLDNSLCVAKFLRYDVTEDDTGNAALVLYFSYTNKSRTSTTAECSFYPQAFQNGIECEWAYVPGVKELENCYTNIQTGTTIDVAFACILTDMSNVTVELNDFMYLEAPKKMVIELQ